MTEQEAIEITMHCLGVQAEQEVCEECPVYHESHITCKEAAIMAISLLQEIQQYREIGTVKECKEAVERKRDDWILVEERLPEEKVNPITHDYYVYPVTFSCEDVVDIRYYGFGGGHWWNGAGCMDKYVTAWMDRPKPYKSVN